ncbi:MOSC domain-containing protein [Halobacteria archaeon AArc-dxtr1]|nr:MOSC domain-containing protein [Halobacteria archaeon AArc-dxtr1]
MAGRVHAIYVAPEQGAPMERVDQVRAVAGRGLVGDRYYDDEGTFVDREGCALTLIEREALLAIEREYELTLASGAHRRNVITTGIDLETLVEGRFRVGEALCVGIEPCDPCAYLERQLGREGVREALADRGGLRARILDGGTIGEGEAVRPRSDSTAPS